MIKTTLIGAIGALAFEQAQASTTITPHQVHTSYFMGDTFELPASSIEVTSSKSHLHFGGSLHLHTFNLEVGDMLMGTRDMIKEVRMIMAPSVAHPSIGGGNIGDMAINENDPATSWSGDYIEPTSSQAFDGNGNVVITLDFMKGWVVGDDELIEEDTFGLGDSMHLTFLQNNSPSFDLVDGDELLGMEVEYYNQDSGEVWTTLSGTTTNYGSGFSTNMNNDQGVPEPSSILLLTLGAIPLIFRRKRG